MRLRDEPARRDEPRTQRDEPMLRDLALPFASASDQERLHCSRGATQLERVPRVRGRVATQSARPAARDSPRRAALTLAPVQQTPRLSLACAPPRDATQRTRRVPPRRSKPRRPRPAMPRTATLFQQQQRPTSNSRCSSSNCSSQPQQSQQPHLAVRREEERIREGFCDADAVGEGLLAVRRDVRLAEARVIHMMCGPRAPSTSSCRRKQA
jgi:hypothetical protein